MSSSTSLRCTSLADGGTRTRHTRASCGLVLPHLHVRAMAICSSLMSFRCLPYLTMFEGWGFLSPTGAFVDWSINLCIFLLQLVIFLRHETLVFSLLVNFSLFNMLLFPPFASSLSVRSATSFLCMETDWPCFRLDDDSTEALIFTGNNLPHSCH